MPEFDPKILTVPSALRRCTHKDADGRQCDLAGIYHVVLVLSSEPAENLHMKVRFPAHRRCADALHCPSDTGFFLRDEDAWASACAWFEREARRKTGRRVLPVWDLSSVEYLLTDEEIDRLEVEWYVPPDPAAGVGEIIGDLKEALGLPSAPKRAAPFKPTPTSASAGTPPLFLPGSPPSCTTDPSRVSLILPYRSLAYDMPKQVPTATTVSTASVVVSIAFSFAFAAAFFARSTYARALE